MRQEMGQEETKKFDAYERFAVHRSVSNLEREGGREGEGGRGREREECIV